MLPHPAFANLDLPGYADLLEVRLREFNRPEERRQLAAMDLFDRTLMRWQPVSDWLPVFYRGLEPDVQPRFRHALAELIGRVRPDQFPLQALEELLGLAGDIGAQEAVAPMLRLVADGGAWALRRPGPLPTVLAVLKQLRPGGEAFDDLLRLHTSTAFADHLVFDVFEILTRARPESWAPSWLMLRGLFDATQRVGPPAGRIEPERWFERRTRDLAQRVLALLEPQTLRLGVDHLGTVLGPALADELAQHRPLGLLWRHLIAEGDSPFQWCDEPGGGTLLCRRGARAGVGVPWPDDLVDWETQLQVLWSLTAEASVETQWEAIKREAQAASNVICVDVVALLEAQRSVRELREAA